MDACEERGGVACRSFQHNLVHLLGLVSRLTGAPPPPVRESVEATEHLPRLPAVGYETGDWSHVDVYLTKTTDYRMLLLGGSRWEPQLLEWTGSRGTTVVGLGAEVPGAAFTLRYRHDGNDDVRLLTETLVGELVAGHAWLAQAAD